MRWVLLLGSLLSVAAVPAAAFPIAPRTLWDISGQADLIVVGEVISQAPVDDSDRRPDRFHPEALGHFGPTLATVRVDDTWKGSVDGSTVVVRYNPTMGCPSPPRFEAGRRLLAFLEETPDGTALRTVALSFGLRYPSDDDWTALRERTLEAVRLQAVPSVTDRSAADWAVRALQDPATEWDGLYEMTTLDTVALRRRHVDAVRSRFLEYRHLDRRVAIYLALLRNDPDPEVTDHAMRLLEGSARTMSDQPYSVWMIIDVIEAVALRLGDSDASRRFQVEAKRPVDLAEPYVRREQRLARVADAELRHLRALAGSR